ncbi:MAG: PHP domain-containing protein [Pseudomonadota bacterium]
MDSNRPPGIDLHIHSTASDGTLSPSEILRCAHALGLAAVSITDHDTVAGCQEALDTGLPEGLSFLTGVEISTAPPPFFPLSGSIHMLGYGIALNNPRLNAILAHLRDSRLHRNPRIIARLNALGMDISLDEVVRESGSPDQVGRPHIAQTMVKKGFAPNFNAAFDSYLGNDRPAYVDKYRVPFDEATDAIRSAGGVAVIAHPGLYPTQNGLMSDATMAAFKAAGVDGVEVYYPEHSDHQTAHYGALADRHGLLKTGGTDFHGALKPDVALGSGYGDLHVPAVLYTRLLNAVGQRAPHAVSA